MKTGEKIRRVREVKGVKQVALARELGITQQRLSQIEQADEIDEATLDKISKALNITSEAIKSFRNNYPLGNTTANDTQSLALNYQIIVTDKLIDVYERLLKEKDSRIQILEKHLQNKSPGK